MDLANPAIPVSNRNDRQKGERRIIFDPPRAVQVMTIDGTCSYESVLIELTDHGARLKVNGRAAALASFFLILNSFGSPVFRLCKRVGVEGQLMGVSFDKTNIGIKSLEEVRRAATLV